MRRWRGIAKRLVYGSVPFVRGKFPYYGHTVYFPRGSVIFEMACEEGIYESPTLRLILALTEPETTYFDVGANIGLLSVPILAERPSVKVVSVEAAPDTLHLLEKTRAATARKEDWQIIGAAVGAQNGETEFWSGPPAAGAYNGVKDTGRGAQKRQIRVPLRTLDEIWHECGRPAVSVVKLDIEGGEYAALQGSETVIGSEQPIFILEWTNLNLPAYRINPESILEFCYNIEYSLFSSPALLAITNKSLLKVAMSQTETFLLIPNKSRDALSNAR